MSSKSILLLVLAGALSLVMVAADARADFPRYHGGRGLGFGYTAPAPFQPLHSHRFVNPYGGRHYYYGGSRYASPRHHFYGGPRYYSPRFYGPRYYMPRYHGPVPRHYFYHRPHGPRGGGHYYHPCR